MGGGVAAGTSRDAISSARSPPAGAAFGADGGDVGAVSGYLG